MNNKIKWIIFALLFVVIIFGASFMYNKLKDNVQIDNVNQNEQSQQTEDIPIDFTVFDKDGNKVKLSDLKGKPVVLNFWATWCPYCVDEMPEFEKMYKKYGDEVHFMMINSTDGYRETVDIAKEFLSEYEYTFPVYYDLNLEANNAFYVNSLPVTFFINKYGNVVTYTNGRTNSQTIEKGINLIR